MAAVVGGKRGQDKGPRRASNPVHHPTGLRARSSPLMAASAVGGTLTPRVPDITAAAEGELLGPVSGAKPVTAGRAHGPADRGGPNTCPAALCRGFTGAMGTNVRSDAKSNNLGSNTAKSRRTSRTRRVDTEREEGTTE